MLSARVGKLRWITVWVADTGPGIDPASMEDLFERFYSTTPAGLGVGLSISRIFVEANGGRLWAENNRGLGVTFSFSLPLATQEP